MIWVEQSKKVRGRDLSLLPAPFARSGHAAGAVCLLMLLLAIPWLLQRFMPADAVKIYEGVPPIYGNYQTIGAELAKPGDIDVLIVGASDAWTSLDPRIIRQRLEQRYGRDMRVLNLGTNWAGEERNAKIIKDFVTRHKVRLVLMPENDSAMKAPHELAKYWWTNDIDTQGLPLTNRAQLYLMSIVGLPRQVWARFRTDERAPLTASYQNYLREQTAALGFNAAKTGWKSHSEPSESNRRPYIDRSAPELSTEVDALFYRGGESDLYFEVRSYEYTAYQTHFTLAARDVVRAHGGVFATFSIPTHFQQAPLEKAWIRHHQGVVRDWPSIGISMTRLFSGMKFDEMVEFYGNESHLNESGAKAYTRALLPAIERLYAQSASN